MSTGTGTCTSAVTWAADANYSGTTQNQTTTAGKLAPTMTFTGAPGSVRDQGTFTVASTTNSSSSPAYTASGSCSNVGVLYTMTSGTGTCRSTVTWASDANYNGATLNQTTTAGKISPTVTFTGALASAGYNSSFNVSATTNASSVAVVTASGACTVTSNAGTISTITMTSGTGTCSLLANWAADNNYFAASASQSAAATKIAPTVAFTGAPATAPYHGRFVIAATTNASTTPAITVSGFCTIAGATVTISAPAGTCTLIAAWPADNNYLAASASQTTTATKATPAINWTAPAAITYGTALSATQLDATAAYNGAAIAGTFLYSPVKDTVLAAGTQTLSVKFTPANATYYLSASASVTLEVNQARPKITWAKPAAITYGTSLSTTQLDATASVAGTFAYSPVKATVLSAGSQTLSVTFTPANSTDYASASASVTLEVNQARPKITWAKPAAIVYGNALSATQLDATASVAGTFVYTPAAGTVPDGGIQTLSVTFTPINTTDYATATSSVTITVGKAASSTAITTSAPNPSTVGQAVTVSFSVAGAGVPTGTVTVRASTGKSCSGTLSVGAGSCSLTFTASGSPALIATYAGDKNFGASTSAKATQTVQP